MIDRFLGDAFFGFSCQFSSIHLKQLDRAVSGASYLVFDDVGLAGFKSRANASLLAYAALSLL